jgi:hypothetical protein
VKRTWTCGLVVVNWPLPTVVESPRLRQFASLLCSGRGRNAKHQRFNFPKMFVLEGQID